MSLNSLFLVQVKRCGVGTIISNLNILELKLIYEVEIIKYERLIGGGWWRISRNLGP